MRPSRNTLAKHLAPGFQTSLLLPLIQEMPQQTHKHRQRETLGSNRLHPLSSSPYGVLLPHCSSLQALHEGSGVLPRVLKGPRAAALLAMEWGGQNGEGCILTSISFRC